MDISNSFTKLGLTDGVRLLRIARIPTPKLNPAALHRVTRGWKYEMAVVSSVVPAAEKAIRPALEKVRIIKVSGKLQLGVGIDYPKPASIGGDRLANAASGVALYGAPLVIVDFGTAVTFDIISMERRYVGGVIAPGLEVMTSYLYQRTALLPKIDLLEPVSAIGKTTRDAMMAGAVFGYRGMVKQIVSEIRKELGNPRKLIVVATGGYADLIAAKLPELHAVHPHLTLEGLRIIGNLNS
jgi:type III pantothenate kinase